MPAAALPRRSVAVLPFANLSADPENDYFSDGLTEELIASLTRLRDLKVISRTSVMQYRSTRKSVPVIARELGVEMIVEGSVRRAGERVRITAQLIAAATDEHLWVETYDRTLEDIFAIQSEVAHRIAEALQAEISALESECIQRRPTANFEAYDLYLRARFLWNQRTEEGLQQSAEYLAQALELDPEFALAAAALADSLLLLGLYSLEPPREVMELARSAADRALALDAASAEALTARACIRALYDWDWSTAEQEFRRALELNPQYAIAHQWYAINLLAPLGRCEQARRELERALELDPLSPSILASKGAVLFFERRFAEAAAELQALLASHPHFGFAYYFLGQVLTAQGRHQEAIAALRRAAALSDGSPEVAAVLAHVLAASGQREEAEAALAALLERSQRVYVSPTLLAQVYLGFGDAEQALTWLHRAYEARAADLVWLKVRPVFDPLRNDPRFAALLRDMRLG